MAKLEKYSQETLNKILLSLNHPVHTQSKYNDTKYFGYKPHNLKILRFVPPGYMDLEDSPHCLCVCNCGRLALKKCNHVINGSVKTCGQCSKSKYNNDAWLGLEINNYRVIGLLEYDDQLYFKVSCINCNSVHEISASGLITGVFSKCNVCYNSIDYVDHTYVHVNKSHKYIDKTDEYIVNSLNINNKNYCVTQCARCSIQRLRLLDDINNLNFGEFKECTCKRIRYDRGQHVEKQGKRKRRFEYYKNYVALEGTKQGKLLIKKFNLANTLRQCTFTCDCDCGNKDIETNAYNVYIGRTTQCGKCLVAPNEKYGNTAYIGQVFRYLKVTDILKVNSKTYWKCTCLNCNSECILPAHAIVYGNNSSCGCMTSVYEKLIADVLTMHEVKFKRQCTFDGLVGTGGGKLKFDFICLSKDDNMIAIEYDGQQHFKPVRFSNRKSEEEAIMDFERAIYHDELKNNFCADNDIPMYRLNGNISTDDVLNVINKENL